MHCLFSYTLSSQYFGCFPQVWETKLMVKVLIFYNNLPFLYMEGPSEANDAHYAKGKKLLKIGLTCAVYVFGIVQNIQLFSMEDSNTSRALSSL